jgi:hypothetical protein
LIDLRCIVGGDVDNARLRRLDRNIVFPALRNRAYILLRRALQVACLLRLGAERLDHVGHVRWLIDESVAEIGGPLQVLAHRLDDGGETREGLDGRIPVRTFNRRKVILCDSLRILLDPALQLNDEERISTGRQYLREQWIRIERNWRQ